MKLTDTLDEQQLLEALIDGSQPKVPDECAGLHVLLSSPFRYFDYPHGSRFRRSGRTPGVIYCSERSSTAIAELAFYRLLFFAESRQTTWPRNACDYTGFSIEFTANRVVDLRNRPFDAAASDWEHLQDYSACQALEASCRVHDVDVIKYKSVRDPDHGGNYALLRCRTFAKNAPTTFESWKLHLGPRGVRAVRDVPPGRLEFDRSVFVADRRIAAMVWDR